MPCLAYLIFPYYPILSIFTTLPLPLPPPLPSLPLNSFLILYLSPSSLLPPPSRRSPLPVNSSWSIRPTSLSRNNQPPFFVSVSVAVSSFVFLIKFAPGPKQESSKYRIASHRIASHPINTLPCLSHGLDHRFRSIVSLAPWVLSTLVTISHPQTCAISQTHHTYDNTTFVLPHDLRILLHHTFFYSITSPLRLFAQISFPRSAGRAIGDPVIIISQRTLNCATAIK